MTKLLLTLALTSATTFGSYVVIDEVLTAHIDTAYKRTQAVADINHQQHVKIATQLYLLEHGALPKNEDVLYAEGYLERPQIPAALQAEAQ